MNRKIKLLPLKVFVLIFICSILVKCSFTEGYRLEGNSIYFEGMRIQVLTPSLFRIEVELGNGYKNKTDLGVVNLDFEKVDFGITPKNGFFEIETDSAILTYYPDIEIVDGGIQIRKKNFNIEITSLSMSDTSNLGGVIGSIDNCLGNRRFNEVKQNDVGGNWDYVSELPGVLSKRGWSVLEWAKDTLKVFQPGDMGRDLFVLVYGHNYKSALNDFYQLAGKIPMLPKWSLGLLYSRWKNYSAEDLENIVLEFRKRNIPLDAVIADMSWHIDGWYGYRYDTLNFPDMKAYHQWTDSMHIKTGFNHHSGSISANDPQIEEFCKRIGIGFDSAVKDAPSWLPGQKVVGYNPSDSAQFNTFYEMYADRLLKDGVDFHWVDGDKTIYSSYYYYENTRKFSGKRPVVLNRLNEITLCNHRYPVGFSGDTYIGWETLKYSLEVTLKGANNGIYWSHDIGGYMPQGPAGYDPTDELFARWLQLGAFSPIFRLHAKNPIYWTPKVGEGDFDPGSRLIWEWGEIVESVGKNSIQLRYNLLPYLYTLSHVAHETGLPMVSPMYIYYPESDNAYTYTQFMAGEYILVAPFTSSSGNGIHGKNKRSLWLPNGGWYDYFTGEKFAGPCIIEVEKSIHEFPVYIKAGSILPLSPGIQYSEQSKDELTIEIYAEPQAGKINTFSLYEDDGISYDFERENFRETKISYVQKKTSGNFVINYPEGKYTDGLSSRYYKVILKYFPEVKDILVNRNEIEKGNLSDEKGSWSCDDDKTIILLKGFSLNENVNIEVIY